MKVLPHNRINKTLRFFNHQRDNKIPDEQALDRWRFETLLKLPSAWNNMEFFLYARSTNSAHPFNVAGPEICTCASESQAFG